MNELISKDKPEDQQLLFTVFTPTYNRVKTLARVYESLKKQTYRNFEWIIIDDGSTDGTSELVKNWQEEAGFPIIYEWKINEGKHITYNLAINMAKGLLFTGIDSDDELIPHSLERFKFHWDNLSPQQKQTIGGVYFPGLDQHGRLVGSLFPNDNEIDEFIKILWKYKVTGDKGAFWQTKVFKIYPFPEQFKNIIVPEGSLIHKMSRDWKVKVINEPLFIIWVNEENRNDHLSAESVLPKHFPGQQYFYMVVLNYSLRYFILRPKLLCGAAFRYARLSFLINKNIWRQYSDLKPFFARFLWIIFMPLGYLSYLKYKIIMRKRNLKH